MQWELAMLPPPQRTCSAAWRRFVPVQLWEMETIRHLDEDLSLPSWLTARLLHRSLWTIKRHRRPLDCYPNATTLDRRWAPSQDAILHYNYAHRSLIAGYAEGRIDIWEAIASLPAFWDLGRTAYTKTSSQIRHRYENSPHLWDWTSEDDQLLRRVSHWKDFHMAWATCLEEKLGGSHSKNDYELRMLMFKSDPIIGNSNLLPGLAIPQSLEEDLWPQPGENPPLGLSSQTREACHCPRVDTAPRGEGGYGMIAGDERCRHSQSTYVHISDRIRRRLGRTQLI